MRFVVNFFNAEKEDTMWIHKINPSVLNDIYKGNKGTNLIRQIFRSLEMRWKSLFAKWVTILIKFDYLLEFRTNNNCTEVSTIKSYSCIAT